MTATTIPAHVAVLDGVELDLRVDHADLMGTTWRWTGARDDRGVHLLQHPTLRTLPIDVVYRDYGPFIPLTTRPLAVELYRGAWTREVA